MTTHVALLKGINVGGHKLVAMADLLDLCARLGLGDARSLLQSGNLVFRSDTRNQTALERLLETEAADRLGLQTTFFVRTADHWKTLVMRNPFPDEARRDPGHLVVMLLKKPVTGASVKALRAALTGPELMHAAGTEAYLVYPDGIGRSRLTTALIEKKLGTSCTGRNWNTVMKLAALATV